MRIDHDVEERGCWKWEGLINLNRHGHIVSHDRVKKTKGFDSLNRDSLSL